jgi:hypothetical protein
MNVPALLLHNSYNIENPSNIENLPFKLTETTESMLTNSYPLRQFWIFPLGFRKFLEPLTTYNPYLETFIQAEILDEYSILETIARLRNSGFRASLSNNIEKYLIQLNRLLTASEVIHDFLK